MSTDLLQLLAAIRSAHVRAVAALVCAELGRKPETSGGCRMTPEEAA